MQIESELMIPKYVIKNTTTNFGNTGPFVHSDVCQSPPPTMRHVWLLCIQNKYIHLCCMYIFAFLWLLTGGFRCSRVCRQFSSNFYLSHCRRPRGLCVYWRTNDIAAASLHHSSTSIPRVIRVVRTFVCL